MRGPSVDVSIVIVNWNSADYLLKCLRSVYEFTRGLVLEIVVVDNASTEPGLEAIEKEFPQAKVIRSPNNVGFARANNLGFTHTAGDCVLFLNPDTELIQPTINILLDSAENTGLEYPVIPNEGGTLVGAPFGNRFEYVPGEAGYSRDAEKIEATMRTWEGVDREALRARARA